MTFRELCSKEVVQLKDGACLGRVDDVELDADTARIGSLLLLGRPRLFGLLGRDETLTIPWADIERIGLDAILVRTDIPAPPPSHGLSWMFLIYHANRKDFHYMNLLHLP